LDFFLLSPPPQAGETVSRFSSLFVELLSIKHYGQEWDFSSETSSRAPDAGFIAKPVAPVKIKMEEQYV